MTKDNHLLGKFELTGIAPAPRGVPQIEVTFQVDANGILQVSAQDKGTGKSQQITITAEKGRLSEDEINRLIEEAEAFAEEDKRIKDKIDSKNGLESYLYNLKNTLMNGDENAESSSKISTSDKKELEDLIDEVLDWMEDHDTVLNAEKEHYDDKLKEVEQIANPIIRTMYQNGGGGGYGDDGDDDFADEDL